MLSMVRFVLPLCTLFIFSILSIPAGNMSAAELRPDLEAYLETLPDDAKVSIIIYLDEQANIASLDMELKEEKATRQVRHERVVRTLKEVASRTQPALINYLKEAKRAGHVTGFTPYWIANLIVAEATKEEINRLVNHKDVGFIEPNFKFGLIDPVASGNGDPKVSGIGITPGVKAINADRVWNELGITGSGRLVANLDTGVDGNHPALASRWRGTLPGVHWSEAWLDNVYGGSQFPVDFYSHGTHVMGTITGLGEATGDTIGVAFGAYWIACNAIDQGTGKEFDNDVTEALQWFADPDGDPFTVDDVPDVVQNSWGINSYFSGYEDCDYRWNMVIDNCEAAGVVVTWSAGNEGPGAQTHRSPANRADTAFNCYSIGAVDATNYNYPYPIAGFSSRGPTDCEGSDFPIKPEVAAPGVDVYSSVPGGGYQGGWSGTSMAGPHVAGVVGLMREANPDLTVDEIKFVLMETAHDFGDVGDDNTYGMGFIDAYEAVFMVMGGIGYLVGNVTDVSTGDPIPADLKVMGSTRETTADPGTGFYSFVLQGDSTYTIQASYFGYETMEQKIYVVADDSTTLDFEMVASASGDLAGLVMNVYNGLPIAGASVEIIDTPINPSGSSSRGLYYFSGVPGGSVYFVQATAEGYGANSERKMIYSDEINLLALPLESGFSDNMENGVNNWTHYNVTSGYSDQWHQSTQRNHTSGGTTSWKCGSTGGGSYGDFVDAGLESPTIDLQENSRLLFYHWMDAEISGGSEAWDGGIVEISIDGGPFEQITPVGGYPYTIISNPDSPFASGTPCFSGSHDWKQEEFDLSGYTGNARIRFRFGTDGYVTEEGWYIDDVIVAPDASTQSVSIMMLPAEEKIEIGPSGGTFEYIMALVNNTNKEQVFDWWIDATIPGGTLYGPIETHTDTLPPLESVYTPGLAQDVPAIAPAGRYIYHGKVGTLPGTVEAISSFQFTKTGAVSAGSGLIEEWRLERKSE